MAALDAVRDVLPGALPNPLFMDVLRGTGGAVRHPFQDVGAELPNNVRGY